MKKIPSITESEWHVMKVLWDRSGQWIGAGDIVGPVAETCGVHHRTVRTLLARLVKKGAVETREPGAEGIAAVGFLYRARVARDEVIREESRSFLSRVFDGNAAPALVHLLSEARDRLSEKEIQELKKLLNAREKR